MSNYNYRNQPLQLQSSGIQPNQNLYQPYSNSQPCQCQRCQFQGYNSYSSYNYHSFYHHSYHSYHGYDQHQGYNRWPTYHHPNQSHSYNYPTHYGSSPYNSHPSHNYNYNFNFPSHNAFSSHSSSHNDSNDSNDSVTSNDSPPLHLFLDDDCRETERTFRSETGITYKLKVMQHPGRARMSGYGGKERRMLSPLPFIRLRLFDRAGPVNLSHVDPNLLHLRAVLHESDNNIELSHVVKNNPDDDKLYENLFGELFTKGQILKDTDGNLDIWFTFKNLSIRKNGKYFIRFSLLDVGCLNSGFRPVSFSACSNPFKVHSSRKFPGMLGCTDLTTCFIKQGLKFPIRRRNSSVKKVKKVIYRSSTKRKIKKKIKSV